MPRYRFRYGPTSIRSPLLSRNQRRMETAEPPGKQAPGVHAAQSCRIWEQACAEAVGAWLNFGHFSGGNPVALPRLHTHCHVHLGQLVRGHEGRDCGCSHFAGTAVPVCGCDSHRCHRLPQPHAPLSRPSSHPQRAHPGRCHIPGVFPTGARSHVHDAGEKRVSH